MAELSPQGIYERLFGRYGDLGWWPAETTYEMMVGAVLTQNTAWDNVVRAIAAFGGDLTPERVERAGIGELAELVRPSGHYNQKALYLKAVTAWYGGYGYDEGRVRERPMGALRDELLAVRGVGRETADSILLYAFGLPTFVVDAYTVRLCERLPLKAGKGYEEIKGYFTAGLPADIGLYRNCHACIVINGKHHCKKRPACAGCPLAEACGGAS